MPHFTSPLLAPAAERVDGEPTGAAFGRPDDRLRETAGEGRSDYGEGESPSPGLLAALVIRPLPKWGDVKRRYAHAMRFKLMGTCSHRTML